MVRLCLEPVVLLVYLVHVVNLVILVLMFHFVHLAHLVYVVLLTHLVLLVCLVQLAHHLYLVPPSWFSNSVGTPGLCTCAILSPVSSGLQG